MLLFTQDGDVELLRRALDCGVHAWVVQGYGAQRLPVLEAGHGHVLDGT